MSARSLPPVSGAAADSSHETISPRQRDASLPPILASKESSGISDRPVLDLNRVTGRDSKNGAHKLDSLPPVDISPRGESSALMPIPLDQARVDTGGKSARSETRSARSAASAPSASSDNASDDSDGDYGPGDSITEASKSSAPVIPPRHTSKGVVLPEDMSSRACWFRILSPREQKGIDGPYSEDELRNMYRLGDLTDGTLLWTEGQTDWEQLLFMKELRPRLITKPRMPAKLGKDVASEVYNPILAMPDKLDAINAEAFNSMPMNLHCSRCGNIAAGHMKGVGENSVDLVGLRKSLPWNAGGNVASASEVLTGLIWVGNASSAKINPILDMGITLVINCTNNMGNPPEKLPYFRCRTIPLKDKPRENPDAAGIAAMMESLEKAYDWMEIERLNPEKALLSDPLPEKPKITEKTDKFGRPIKSVEEIAVRLRIGKEKRTPRILLWSRKGLDRPCFLAAAYMIRQYGMPIEKALGLIDIARPGTIICRFYKICLEAWSQKYTRGEMLCIDCLNVAKENTTHSTHNEVLMSNDDLFKEHLHKDKDGDSAASVSTNNRNERASRVLGAYLDLLPTEAEATKITRAIGEVNVYLKKLYFGPSIQSGWTGLLDLDLFGHALGDDIIVDLFGALHSTGVSKQLRTIGMGSTKCGCRGMIAIQRSLCSSSAAAALPPASPADRGESAMSSSFADGSDAMKHKPPSVSGAGVVPSLHLNKAFAGLEQQQHNNFSLSMDSATAEWGPSDELVDLDMSNNSIKEDGSKAIAEVLRQVQSLISLNIAYNPLGDSGCQFIVAAVSPPIEDFFHVELGAGKSQSISDVNSKSNQAGPKKPKGGGASVGSGDHFLNLDARYNMSLTSLNMSCTQMGHGVAEMLLDTFRLNNTISRFIMDYNMDFTPTDFKHMLNSFRSYNRTIQCLSFADMPLSIKTFGNLARLLETGSFPLQVLDITKTDLRMQHIQTLCEYLIRSKHLKRLSIGSNEIGDDAACALAYACKKLTLEEKEERRMRTRAEKLEGGMKIKDIEREEHEHASLERAGMRNSDGPPLVSVDFSHMGLSPRGSKALLQAACTRETLTHLNLSGNDLGTDLEPLRPWLETASFRDLHVNNCCLGSLGAATILNIVSNVSCALGSSMRALDLSSNGISDIIAPELVNVLNENMSIEVLDLGFNAITNSARDKLMKAYAVTSGSRVEKKVYSLHINVVGNKCDPYMLGEPGMGRSKAGFRFGVGPALSDELNDGYSHISQISRVHYFDRKAANDAAENLHYPIKHLN